MQNQKYLIFLFILLPVFLFGQQKEVRGTWLAWAGNDIPTKDEIPEIMEKLAENNFNTVYVDVWRYGYPYFRSEVFYKETGLYTDPQLEEGRDILSEFIAEGHRYGLNVDAWFEAGFQACAVDNRDLFFAHPEWFAQKLDGSYDFFSNGGIRYNWLSHTNKDAQQFLIDLVLEVVRKYDVDGIDFDRVRYPELNCGYDSATVELYRSEHNGSDPPTSFNNSSWIRWRADKLNEFMAAIYDSIKSESPDMHVSNAPLWYGYEQFCQDWPAWINNGWLDTVVPQLYYADNSTYQFRLSEELKKTGPDSLFHPGISTIANSVETPPNELIKMIETTRNNNLPGHVIWYHARLDNYYEDLKNNVYQEKVLVPYRNENWRLDAIVINEDDTTVSRSDGWTEYTTLPGLDGKCLFSTVEDGDFIEYSADVKKSGWYEVYAFIVTQFNAHTDARYQLFSSNGVDTIYVNQSIPGIRRWYKLSDIYLEAGKQTVLRLDDEGLGSKVLFTDAIMLLNSNRANIEVTSIKKNDLKVIYPSKTELLPNYPNPFNPATTINYLINQNTQVELSVFNTLGKKVASLVNKFQTAGEYKETFNAADLSSGIYFVKLQTENVISSQKIILLK